MNIYYQNSVGKKVDLLGPQYYIGTSFFPGHEWTFDTTEDSSGYGGIISNIKMGVQEGSVEIKVCGAGKILNELFDTFDTDVLSNTPGRLYIGNQYYICLFTGTTPSVWNYGLNVSVFEFSIASPNPFWTTETMQEFHVSSARVGNTKRYPYRYPCKYIGGNGIGYLINNSHADSNFIFRIFGPVSSPQIVIGGYAYCIYENLEDGEYLKADSRKGTIVKVARSGAETNAFGKKQNRTKFFKKIPTGSLPVEWSGNFSFDITLFDERSEPRWE